MKKKRNGPLGSLLKEAEIDQAREQPIEIMNINHDSENTTQTNLNDGRGCHGNLGFRGTPHEADQSSLGSAGVEISTGRVGHA
ncbi:hypothetical protein TNCV_1705261 [Trichonephila clavipes]|uniref:Uncharacterized protein n=1 Tax=Trichonephila clavipes TaxID=2585209 RepID=A0A8X6RDB9_TRICX|nr:hypothetical protein TNCV_1705261 [Trichonephila clavipes]